MTDNNDTIDQHENDFLSQCAANKAEVKVQQQTDFVYVAVLPA